MGFRLIKNLFAGAFFLICLWSILATSQLENSITKSGLQVTSDCVSPVLDRSVTTVGGQIVSPAGLSYTDFGFPAATVNLNTDVIGTVNGLTRTCTQTYGNSMSSSQWIF